MVILLLVHLVQVFVWGAYKRPRELHLDGGRAAAASARCGLAFTGYLLPWDQKAYWATKVGLGIASTIPLVGDGPAESSSGRAADRQPDADSLLHDARLLSCPALIIFLVGGPSLPVPPPRRHPALVASRPPSSRRRRSRSGRSRS